MSTASGLEREIACPASAVLGPISHETSEAAIRGTTIHRFVRAVAAGADRQHALTAITNEAWRETCAKIDFAKLCGGILDVRAEAAYRLNVETDEVTFLGLNLDRRYPPRPNAPLDEFVDGTNDVEGRRFDGVPIVSDVKTGWYVTRCHENPQMRFHARVQMITHPDEDRVEGRLTYVHDDGSIHFDTHLFTRFEVDSFGDELVALKGAIRHAHGLLAAGIIPTVHGGDHCRYCPSAIACPRYALLARAMLPEIQTIEAKLSTMTLEERSRAWTLQEEAQDLLDRIRSALQTMARHEPIPLPNGKLLKQIESTSSSFDKARALAMLRDKGVTDDEIASLTTKKPTYPVQTVNDPSVIDVTKPKSKRAKRSAA